MKAPRGFTRHHVLWSRCDYTESWEKRLRSHQGLVPAIPNELHFNGYPDSVHTLMDAPPKPEKIHILGAVALLDRQTDNFLRVPQLAIELVANYFGSDRNEELGNHLYHQLEIYGKEIQNG